MSSEGNSFKKKKKGRSFLQKAKKFGRQGQRGRGTEIEQDQYDYLVRVLERWRQGFHTEEEKVTMAPRRRHDTPVAPPNPISTIILRSKVKLIKPMKKHRSES